MDMKKILQAFDGASPQKPVEGSSDMKKFLQIMEGKGPSNRLTTAETLAVQHYQEVKPETLQPLTSKKTSLIDKYYKQVELEFTESQEQKTVKSKKLAERVASKINEGVPRLSKHVSQSEIPPDSVTRMAKQGASKLLRDEKADSVTLDVPLMIRLLEYAREDAGDDMDLHQVAERLIELSQKVDVINMDHYDAIVTGNVDESLRTDNPCWKGYKPVGTKKKGGRTVPNCVPK